MEWIENSNKHEVSFSLKYKQRELSRKREGRVHAGQLLAKRLVAHSWRNSVLLIGEIATQCQAKYSKG